MRVYEPPPETATATASNVCDGDQPDRNHTSLAPPHASPPASKPKSRRVGSHLIVLVLRVAGMGGKFVMVMFAARCLNAADFGRFGIITAATWLGVMVVGLEVQTVVLRDLVRTAEVEGRKLRGFFVLYMLLAGAVAGLIAAGLALAAGWGPFLAFSVACLMFVEYVGQELTRLLAADGSPAKSTLAIFMRGGLWCYLMAAGTIVGLISQTWTLGFVVWSWIASDLLVLTLLGGYRRRVAIGQISLGSMAGRVATIVAKSWPFILASFGFQVLLSGGRFSLALFSSEVISGRFTLISTLASVSLVMVKGVSETIYFPLIVGDRPRDHWPHFVRSVTLMTAASCVVSIVAAAICGPITGKRLSSPELVSLSVLLLAYAMLSFVTIPKFKLYASNHDRKIMSWTVAAVVVFVASSLVFVPRWELLGASLATAASGATILFGKLYSARHPFPETSKLTASLAGGIA